MGDSFTEYPIRPHLLKLKPYSTARDEFKGSASVYLDANENSLGGVEGEFNRYPDPHNKAIKARLSAIKGIPESKVFVGSGSDEAIDLLIRATCEPFQDKILVFPPTYGMYEVSADIHGVGLVKINLDQNFQLRKDAIIKSLSPEVKIIFVCSPNNPSGNLFSVEDVEWLCSLGKHWVVVDEAYIDYCEEATKAGLLGKYKNLIIIQTLSKAWGMASLRVGWAFGNELLIDVLEKIKPPYNLSGAVQALAMKALGKEVEKKEKAGLIIEYRKQLEKELGTLSIVEKVFPSEANFLLAQFKCDANQLFEYLLQNGIVVRNRSSQVNCHNCLRITIGTEIENQLLLKALNEYQPIG